MTHSNEFAEAHSTQIPELAELNQIRLAEGLTYRELADLVGLSFRTVHQLLNAEAPQPFDRTLYKIRRFLDARNAATSKPAGKKKAS